MKKSAEVVICGAGIAGISAAYHLAVKHGIEDILIVDPNPPLSLTSDKSTECYRNWWPGPGSAMVDLMNRSIDLLEELARESSNTFNLSRRGYLYLTADAAKIPAMRQAAAEISAAGAGPLRVHEKGSSGPAYEPSPPDGFEGGLPGADLILDPDLLHAHYPDLTSRAAAGLHVRRAGWFSAQQMGAYLLEKAHQAGVHRVPAKVAGVEISGGKVVAARLEDGQEIRTTCFINAAGPMFKEVGGMLGLDLPVFTELHLKAAIADPLQAVPRTAPLLIWNDPQYLPWTEAERQVLADDPETTWLTQVFPPGAHVRPEGGLDSTIALLLWEYQTHCMQPVWPIPLDSYYPEIVARGLSAMLPALKGYFEHLPRPLLDGGYYTKTPENRPLICPSGVPGAYLIGALSGYGLMASGAAGELLALHVTNGDLPAYAPAFELERYLDPAYLKSFEHLENTGQL